MKKFLNMKSYGFTLMELIISMGILMVLIGMLTTVFGQILDVQLESQAISSVDSNGRYILARLIHDTQSAESIASPSTVGVPVSELRLVIGAENYTYSVSNSGNLVLTNNFGTDVLNSNAASISGLTFTRIGNGSNTDTIRVGFTITTRTIQQKGFEQKSFQTTLGLQ